LNAGLAALFLQVVAQLAKNPSNVLLVEPLGLSQSGQHLNGFAGVMAVLVQLRDHLLLMGKVALTLSGVMLG
jgi:hypothetical protein